MHVWAGEFCGFYSREWLVGLGLNLSGIRRVDCIEWIMEKRHGW